MPPERDGFFYADDSIALISTKMYREHVLPYHRQTFAALATQKGRAIHLCGDATRHFPTIQAELNVRTFDTGFPVDFAKLRVQLGPGTRIQGGPHAELLRCGTPEQVYAESVRILQSGVLEGGNFVLREGNNLAPGTPPENTEAMYRAGKDSGFRIQGPGTGGRPSASLVPRSAQDASEPGTRNPELETRNAERPGDRLAGFDFLSHNAEVKGMWAAYRAGSPIRTPVIVGTTTRFFMAQPEANPERLTFREYTEDPDAMFDAQLRFARWRGYNILQDAELGLGLPERWQVSVDFQNYWEPAWFGCPVEYVDGEVPDTRPAFEADPERIMENGLPDPFGGIMARGLEYHERFVERAAKEEYLGRPIEVLPPWYGVGYNGPMTMACALFGPGWTCEAMALEEDRLQTLLGFITDATIARMDAWRRRCGVPVPEVNGGGMDDSVALISVPMFRIHILPHLKRIYETFTTGRRAIHMCGDATRHFPLLQKEIGIQSFDTGFPVDFGKVRAELGPEAEILGGPHVELLRSGTPAQVYAETARILETGILSGGRFTLREGNNLGPRTPLENTEAMYRAGREHGYRKETA
jgi:uroporphyrinogen-III decarboxylase